MTVRTSASDPLRIGWVEAPAPWRIGITIAPGKRAPSRFGHRWERDLDADLDTIVANGARTLVCLVEDHELTSYAIGALPDSARRHGLAFVRSPIRDVSVPSLTQMRTLVAELMPRRGKPIVVHCIGGLGRSGTVVGCLLRACGVDGSVALERLVAARGRDCPETAEQKRFVETFSME